MAPDVGGLLSLALLLALVLVPLAWVARHYAVRQDLRTVRRVFRLDALALAVGGLLLAASAALLVLAWVPDSPVTMTICAGLLALGTAAVTVAVGNRDWYRWSRQLPVVAPDEVEPGPVQLEGRAIPLDDRVPSSVTQTDTLAYRAVTHEEYAVLGRGYAHSTWSSVSVADDAVPFGIVSAAALGGEAAEGGRELPGTLRAELGDSDVELPADAKSVAVDGPNAEFPLLSPTSRLARAGPAGSTLDGLERTVPAEPGATAPVSDELARGTRSRPREYSERRLDPGDPVYVLGTARETADGEIEIVDEPDGPPLLVVRVTAEAAKAHARRFCRTYGLLGLGLLAVGAGILVSVGL
ncbi:hypothetical protein GCM10028857_24900 [Salinarchaeum chitinilyticum]